jgi:hypothetical protein
MTDQAPPGQPRLCAGCGRALPALDRSEYTDARAALIITSGLCTCTDQQRTDQQRAGRPAQPAAARSA